MISNCCEINPLSFCHKIKIHIKQSNFNCTRESIYFNQQLNYIQHKNVKQFKKIYLLKHIIIYFNKGKKMLLISFIRQFCNEFKKLVLNCFFFFFYCINILDTFQNIHQYFNSLISDIIIRVLYLQMFKIISCILLFIKCNIF